MEILKGRAGMRVWNYEKNWRKEEDRYYRGSAERK